MPIIWTLPPPPAPPALASEAQRSNAPATAQQPLQPLMLRAQPSTNTNGPIWELLEEPELPVQADPPGPLLQPLDAELVDALVNSIPLTAADYRPLLRLSPAVPTAHQLAPEQWRFSAFQLSPFDSGEAKGTGNQNYAINFDVGLSEALQLSAFFTQADDPLNARLKGFSQQPANFWGSYGAAARWRLLDQGRWRLALNGSVEGWNVGSGGDDSFNSNGDSASPNIFNNSGKRVFTKNLVGSLAVPLSWQANDQWQLTFSPGVSFLPANQGGGQGGSGNFYGTNIFVSGGVLWQPIPELGLVGSALMPLGPGTNSFNTDLDFTRVPILSAGLNWDLNPRIGFRGLLTNGFGATPATALLALPSDNRLGYSASFVFTPDAPDTPQPKLSFRQRSLAKGGLTVNTALVPPDDNLDFWLNADSGGNINGFLGYSISNVFQLFLFSGGLYNNVPQSTVQARTYANDGAYNWRVSGKAVAFSPLRGAPIWGAGRISFGRNADPNNSFQGYVFAETISTWEATPNVALNVNPKVAVSGVGNLWGLGVSANVQLAPRWELVPEANVVLNEVAQSNGTLGVRWHATDSVSVDVYGSTAASILDIGQLISADEVRWGGRLIYSF